MRCTTEGIQLIKDFEHCSLVAYSDAGGVLTIGWGRARGVQEGDTCTQEQADQWLLEDIQECENLVLAYTPHVLLTNNEISALISFLYNVGTGKKGVKDGLVELKDGGHSTLLDQILVGNFALAAAEFPKWVKIGGIPSAGLLRRRLAEKALFLAPAKEMSNAGS